MGFLKGQLTFIDLFVLLISFFIYFMLFAPLLQPLIESTIANYFNNSSDPQAAATALVMRLTPVVVLIGLLFTAIQKSVPHREGMGGYGGG